MPACGGGIDRPQLGRDNTKALVLQTADDLADEATLHRVGFTDDKGAFHGRGR
jgi:hypothetical protein